jgi:hypothetical protein
MISDAHSITQSLSLYREWRERAFPGSVRPATPHYDGLWDEAESFARTIFIRDNGAEAAALFEREAKYLQLLLRIVPDPTRDPYSFWTLLEHKIAVEVAAQRLGYRVPVVFLDTISDSSVNAFALRMVDSGHQAIVLDPYLNHFVCLTVDIVFEAWRQLPRDFLNFNAIPDSLAVQVVVRENPAICQQFSRILLELIVRRNLETAASYAIQYLMPDAHRIALQRSAQIFMLGHEYGHFIGEHLTGKLPPDYGINIFELADGQRIEQRVDEKRKWNDECQADEIGATLLLEVTRTRRWEPDVAFAGLSIFLTCREHLDHAKNILFVGRVDVPPSPTHPPAYTRGEVLRRYIERTMPHDAAEMMKRVGLLIECLVKAMFEQALPYVVAERVRNSEGRST